MLILVAVAVRVAVDSGLFGHAKDATNKWADAQNKEANIGDGPIEIGGKTYGSIDDYLDEIKKGELPSKHPDQSAENNDIGIGTDGQPVNLDLWRYTLLGNQTYRLCGPLFPYYDYAMESGYIGPFTESGEIIGTVPQYIVNSETGVALPVTDMTSTFYECENLVKAPKIPETVEYFNSTFYYCTNLSSINIPNSVTSIGYNAFYNCISLTNINIPNSVTSIGYAAFDWCSSLTSINIPNSVTSIGNWAFSNCTNLTSINIPNSVTSIENWVFGRWTETQTINCQATKKSSGWSEKWNYYDYSTPCKATVNWGVSM